MAKRLDWSRTKTRPSVSISDEHQWRNGDQASKWLAQNDPRCRHKRRRPKKKNMVQAMNADGFMVAMTVGKARRVDRKIRKELRRLNNCGNANVTRGSKFDSSIATHHDTAPWIDDPVGETDQYDELLFKQFGLIVYDD
jgi:hypothetical protein